MGVYHIESDEHREVFVGEEENGNGDMMVGLRVTLVGIGDVTLVMRPSGAASLAIAFAEAAKSASDMQKKRGKS